MNRIIAIAFMVLAGCATKEPPSAPAPVQVQRPTGFSRTNVVSAETLALWRARRAERRASVMGRMRAPEYDGKFFIVSIAITTNNECRIMSRSVAEGRIKPEPKSERDLFLVAYDGNHRVVFRTYVDDPREVTLSTPGAEPVTITVPEGIVQVRVPYAAVSLEFKRWSKQDSSPNAPPPLPVLETVCSVDL